LLGCLILFDFLMFLWCEPQGVFMFT
jgi:hypothetical protein